MGTEILQLLAAQRIRDTVGQFLSFDQIPEGLMNLKADQVLGVLSAR